MSSIIELTEMDTKKYQKLICSECKIIILCENTDYDIFVYMDISNMSHQCLECNDTYCKNCKKPESQLCKYCTI